MAIMIPKIPHEYDRASKEGLIFGALETLPDDYYVLHSMKIAFMEKNDFEEHEGDFVIFHPKKGVIVIEAKAGHPRHEHGTWYYGSGIRMKHGGPFRQADNFKHNLIDLVRKRDKEYLLGKCKFLHAVWFHTMGRSEFAGTVLPPDCVIEQLLFRDDLLDPAKALDRIFAINMGPVTETNLNKADSKTMLREILCPEFEIIPASSFDNDIREIVFHHLLREQANILNFLVEQRTAVINGAAGTGKTMIGIEKARRNAALGTNVLFLCFNNQLKDYLASNYQMANVDYYTISGYACKVCKTSVPDYDDLVEKLIDLEPDEFEYDHIVIDEGQDFGIDAIEDSGIMEVLKELVVAKKGSFYVFYDNLQLIQGRRIPEYIKDADCKLTLYRNCRNTINIAKTSLKAVTEREPELIEGCDPGKPVVLNYCKSIEDVIKRVDNTLDKLASEGVDDVVILTCKTEEKSILADKVSDGKYNGKVTFSTCRKFKGLEASAVILVDVDKSVFEDDNILLFYVGTSRARIRLDIFSMLNAEECQDLLENVLNIKEKINNPRNDFAVALNSIGKLR